MSNLNTSIHALQYELTNWPFVIIQPLFKQKLTVENVAGFSQLYCSILKCFWKDIIILLTLVFVPLDTLCKLSLLLFWAKLTGNKLFKSVMPKKRKEKIYRIVYTGSDTQCGIRMNFKIGSFHDTWFYQQDVLLVVLLRIFQQFMNIKRFLTLKRPGYLLSHDSFSHVSSHDVLSTFANMVESLGFITNLQSTWEAWTQLVL